MDPATLELWAKLIDKYGLWVILFGALLFVLHQVAKSFLPPLGAVIIKQREVEIERTRKEIETLEATKQAIAQVPHAIAAFEKSIQASEERQRTELTRAKADLEARVSGAVADIKASITDDRHSHLDAKVDKLARRASIPDSDPPPDKHIRRDSNT